MGAMDRVLNIAAVALVISAAYEQANARGEDSQVKPPNPWKEFWNQNCALLIFRTTYGLPIPCSWYLRNSLDDKGVNVTLHAYLVNQKYGRNMGQQSWKFGEENSTTWIDNIGSIRKRYLDYAHPNQSCGVIRYVDYENDDVEVMTDKESQCANETGAERCKGRRCERNPEDDDMYLCKDGPFYDLLVNAENKNNVPDECTQFYEEKTGETGKYEFKDINECTYLEDKKAI